MIPDFLTPQVVKYLEDLAKMGKDLSLEKAQLMEKIGAEIYKNKLHSAINNT